MHHRQRRSIFLLRDRLDYSNQELHDALRQSTGESSLQNLPAGKAAKFIRYLLRCAGLPAHQDLSLTLSELKPKGAL